MISLAKNGTEIEDINKHFWIGLFEDEISTRCQIESQLFLVNKELLSYVRDIGFQNVGSNYDFIFLFGFLGSRPNTFLN